ncbi:MAG: restriction endonuclease subunit S [Hassallia sp. WJT32-NPBG1]|jgi:type I restriction enzyme S subunit|nr:restriction endonuclease subunit S [Hassallia sp. WJT32-NPBG1]
MVSDGWQHTKLGEFVSLRRGHDLPEPKRKPGKIPVLGSFGITGYHDTATTTGPGVTVGRSGASFGVVSYSLVDFWALNTALYVIDFHGNDELFAYYFLKSIDFQRYNSGGAQPSLNRNFIYPIPVKVPPLHEQKAIAQSLSDVDALITECDRLITKKRNTKQGTMQQLLTGKKRLPGFSGEWELKKLGEALKVRHGKSQHDVVNKNGEFPILATGGEIGRAKTYLYDKPSVLIGRKGTIDIPQYMDIPFWTIDTLFYTEILTNAFPKFIFIDLI